MNGIPNAWDVRSALYNMNLPEDFLTVDQIGEVLEQVKEDDAGYAWMLRPPSNNTIIEWAIEELFDEEIQDYRRRHEEE